MHCPNPRCGAENADTARFCRACGAPLGAAQTGDAEPTLLLSTAKPDRSDETVLLPRRPHAAPPGHADDRILLHASSGDDPGQEQGFGDRFGRPLFLISILVALVVGIALLAWLYLEQSAVLPAPSAPVASTVPTPAPTPPPSMPPVEQPLAPAPTPEPAAATPVLEVPAAKPAEEPAQPPVAVPAAPEREATRPHADEERVKAERARKRHDARMAREATDRLAREATTVPSQPPPPSSPQELCAGESAFTRNGCEARVCQSKEWMFSPFCVERRRQEEQKRQGTFGTDR